MAAITNLIYVFILNFYDAKINNVKEITEL